MHLLFRPFKAEVDVDWAKEYGVFLEDDSKIRKAAARSLHEAFKLIEADEDSSAFRECLHDLMTDGTKKILAIVNQNLSTFIRLYCNKHMLDQHLDPETNS